MALVDNVRPFAPGLKKFILSLLCLQAIALTLIFNWTVSVALISALAACLVKMYQLDPEPILLLLLHTAISTSMLLDPTTTLALIIIMVSGIITYGDYDLPTERVVVFVLALTTTAVFGKVTAIVASVAIAIVIVIFKLRPLSPPAVSLLALGCLALVLPINNVVGIIVVFLYISIVTGLYIFNRVRKGGDLELSDRLTPERNKPAYPNGYLPLSNITESLDLHGHTVTGAMKVLHAFLREQEEEYRKNRAPHVRHVTIITGSGDQTDPHNAANLVKPTVVNFLKINKYKYDIPSDTPGLIKVDLESHAL